MATYLVLNLVFISVVVVALHRMRTLTWNRVVLTVLTVLLVTTAIFDSLLIELGLFSYADARILGIHIGAAPIEDFFYAVLAAVLVPSLWNYFGRKSDEG